jgi:hypothetical protein
MYYALESIQKHSIVNRAFPVQETAGSDKEPLGNWKNGRQIHNESCRTRRSIHTIRYSVPLAFGAKLTNPRLPELHDRNDANAQYWSQSPTQLHGKREISKPPFYHVQAMVNR